MKKITAIAACCLLAGTAFAQSTPAAQPASAAAAAPAAGDVWVNSNNVYHCPGTRYHGKTKNGRYMTEEAAKAAGARPSNGKACKPA